jgi:hypothetical protein
MKKFLLMRYIEQKDYEWEEGKLLPKNWGKIKKVGAEIKMFNPTLEQIRLNF